MYKNYIREVGSEFFNDEDFTRLLCIGEKPKDEYLYYCVKELFKGLYDFSNEDSIYRMMYVNFLDFLENERGFPIDAVGVPMFLVSNISFRNNGDSLYAKLKSQFGSSEKFYTLGKLKLDILETCLEFSSYVAEKNIVEMFVKGVVKMDIRMINPFDTMGFHNGLFY